jgi:hypothetical protein
VLDVAAVMKRYGLRDRRAARRLMDDAGAFLVAGRIVVREDRLAAREEEQMRARRGPERPPDTPPTPRRARRSAAGARAPLAPGWWRESREGV